MNVDYWIRRTHPLQVPACHKQVGQLFRHGRSHRLWLGKKPVKNGDDDWIGADAMVLPGVAVGNGGSVAAVAVVTGARRLTPSWPAIQRS
jgi:acetyltransferase-like isoleucine patch superfamily enzyme